MMTSPYLVDDIGPTFGKLKDVCDVLLAANPVRLTGDGMTIAAAIISLELVLNRINAVHAWRELQAAE